MTSETCIQVRQAGSVDAQIDALFSCFDLQTARLLERALSTCADQAPSTELLKQMHRLCVLYAHYSKPSDGYSIARAGVRAARRLGDREALRKALTARGSLRRMAGDINGAIEDHVEAYKLARELNDRSITPSSLANLIFALGLIDLDELALRLAETALAEMPPNPVGFSALNAAASLMLNTADLLLGRDPRRALHLACHAEECLRGGTGFASADEQVELQTKVATALVNQVIAAVNLRDERVAARAVGRLQTLLDTNPHGRSRYTACTAMATFEAHFGDRRRGLRELRSTADSGVDEAAVDASRRLIEFYEANGYIREANEVLFALQKRLQAFRRTVCLEELRRIDALDQIEEFDDFQTETERRLLNFGVRAYRVSEQLRAKLQHLESIAVNAEMREGTDMNRAQHAYRVGKLCSELAAEAGCGEETQWLAEVAGRLHDIGKCAVPDAIILQSSPLPEDMRVMLREHSEYGARLIADADEPSLIQVVAAVRHHHERFDGTGYPSRLAGEDIPLLGRVVAICESFDAMLQSRPYRGSRTVSRALEEIERCASTQFDPWLAGLFVQLVREMQRRYGDILEYLGSQARFSSSVRTFEQLERLMPRGGLA